MTTAARPTAENASHWYHHDGTPCYEVPNKSRGGMRPTTIKDAMKLGLLPSVTTLLRVLDKPALNDWRCEQAVLAAMTTPRNDGEELDAFIHRVLHVERHQDAEMQAARDLGSEMHDAMDVLWRKFGERMPNCFEQNDVYRAIAPAYLHIAERVGKVIAVEEPLVGPCYAGRVDLIADCGDHELICDWKTTKSLPKKPEAWLEHRLQLAAYAEARQLAQKDIKPIRTANVYISTVNQGEFVYCENPPWEYTYEHGFVPLVKLWAFVNDYDLDLEAL